MIVSCPECAARLRLDSQRLSGKRVTLRCARCRKIFQVAVPGKGKVEEPLRVLIAHSDEELCRTVVDVLSREGLDGRVCHDGHQALQSLQQGGAQVAVIDVALPGLLAFELIEQVRRAPQLEHLRIILLSSVFNRTAYKRTPTSLYGADDYIEKHHIPDDLVPKINRLVAAAGPGGAGTQVTVGADCATEPGFLDAMNNRIQAAEEREIEGAGEAGHRQKAQRLARIIVSDIALYNQERVDEGVQGDRFYELLANEIAEGRRLFLERLPAGGEAPLEILEEALEAIIRDRRRELGL